MMGWFADLKIKVKLILGYFVLCLVMLCVGAMGLAGLQTMDKNIQSLYYDSLTGISNIKELKGNIQYTRLIMQRIALPQFRSDIPAMEKELSDLTQTTGTLLKNYEGAITNPEDTKMFQDLQKSIADYRNARQRLLDMAKSNDYTAAGEVYANQVIQTNIAIIGQLDKMSAWNDNVGKNYIKNAEESYSSAFKSTISIIVFGLILSLVSGFFLARAIERSLKGLVDISNEVASGNLRHNITVHSKDETGQLEAAVKKMVENLRNVITNVQSSAELVASSSEELTASADQSAQAANSVATSIMSVSQGAERQLDIVGETVHTAEKMSAEAEQIAANANIVAATSDKTAQAAERGSSAVETAVNQMASIQTTVENLAKEITGLGMRSQEIGQIVETISGIAGQTNLLALNAAIEAARAGEQGRGFAVVAEEVRKLAEQSGEAAKQISSLIGAIQNDTSKAVQAMEIGTREVRTGSELVNNAGVAFKEITVLIDQTSSQVREISEAIQAMANDSQNIVTGAQEVNRLSRDTSSQTQSVSAATEEQLASMEEIASSSQALAKRAEDLQAIAQKFTI